VEIKFGTSVVGVAICRRHLEAFRGKEIGASRLRLILRSNKAKRL
jgi:hypothetical protein